MSHEKRSDKVRTADVATNLERPPWSRSMVREQQKQSALGTESMESIGGNDLDVGHHENRSAKNTRTNSASEQDLSRPLSMDSLGELSRMVREHATQLASIEDQEKAESLSINEQLKKIKERFKPQKTQIKDDYEALRSELTTQVHNRLQEIEELIQVAVDTDSIEHKIELTQQAHELQQSLRELEGVSYKQKLEPTGIFDWYNTDPEWLCVNVEKVKDYFSEHGEFPRGIDSHLVTSLLVRKLETT